MANLVAKQTKSAFTEINELLIVSLMATATETGEDFKEHHRNLRKRANRIARQRILMRRSCRQITTKITIN